MSPTTTPPKPARTAPGDTGAAGAARRPTPAAESHPLPGSLRFGDADECRRFMRVLLGLLLVVLLAIAALNVVVNPLATFDHRVVRPAVLKPATERKHLLFGRHDWDVLVLGSSRTEKFDPDMLRPEGGARDSRGFNAALARTGFVDQAAWTFYSFDNPGRDGKPPQAVITLVAGLLRSPQPSASLVSTEPVYASLMRRVPERGSLHDALDADAADAGPGAVEDVADVGRILWAWETTRLSLGQLRSVARGRSGSDFASRMAVRMPSWPYAPNGVLLDRPADVRAMTNRDGYNKRIADLATQRAEAEPVAPGAPEPGTTSISKDGARLFSMLVREANRRRMTPIVVLSPLNPDVTELVRSENGMHQLRDLRRFLEPYAADGRIELIDFAETRFEDPRGNHRAWLDTIHPTSLTTERIMREIGRRSKLVDFAPGGRFSYAAAKAPAPAPAPASTEAGS